MRKRFLLPLIGLSVLFIGLVFMMSCDNGTSSSSLEADEIIIGTWSRNIVGHDVTIRFTNSNTFIARAEDAGEIVGIYSTEDNRLSVTDHNSSICGGLTGIYEFDNNTDGTVLTLTALDEECGGRRDVLDETWTKM